MKRLLGGALVLVAVGAFLLLTVGASSPSPVGQYTIVLDNAFGLTTGADFKVAGVPVGKVGTIELPQACGNGGGNDTCKALVHVKVIQKGFAQFRTDAFCQSRPESLIGEYFVECEPGTKGKVLPPGSTIPVQNTESTIPFDLVNDIQQMPYRQRLSLIINELGAAVAGRSGDLQDALRRAVPALTQTDNLLNLLANDSNTIKALTSDSNTVITELANNGAQLQRFITEANNASTDSATQQANISRTWARLPGFLEELRPTMRDLGAAADANDPVLRNLLASADQLHTLFTNIADCSKPHNDSQCGFANASRISLKPLGKASVVGKAAVEAARPTIRDLNRFTGGTNCLNHDLNLDAIGAPSGANSGFNTICLPELAQNLAIVLNDLENRSRAVEPDARSPGGQGFTGLEALLWYVFVQPLSINNYTQFGHILSVNAFIDPRCSPYATPQSIANNLKSDGPAYRQCYAWYGPNQPGVNEPDPSRPSACVPDPGGAPPGQSGPNPGGACTLQANPAKPKSADTSSSRSAPRAATSGGASTAQPNNTSSSPPSGGGGSPNRGVVQTLGRLLTAIDGGPPAGGNAPAARGSGTNSNAGSSASSATTSGAGASQAQQLLNYLLAP
jgi:virulence factor Mce-like protein